MHTICAVNSLYLQQNNFGMLPAKKIIAAVVIMFISVAALAQPPKTPARGTPVQKIKPPKLISSLGNRSDSVVISVDEASNPGHFANKDNG